VSQQFTDQLPFIAGPVAHDPGGSKRFRLKPGVRGSAEFSLSAACYRYWLRRDWDDPQARPGYLLSVGCNPSTAEANIDDPTLRLDQAIARREGFASLIKVNICDYRLTNKGDLTRPDILARSDDNLRHIRELAASAAKIVVCWGSLPESLLAYAEQTVAAMPRGAILWCLGRTKDGQPRHPLYIAGGTPLEPWPRPPRTVRL
jgi:hypothetical protein